MAVTTVTTDLSPAYTAGAGEVTDAASATGWSEPTGTGGTSTESYADMKAFQTEADVIIEGTGAMSGGFTSNNPDRGGLIFNRASTTVPTDGAVLIWMWWISPKSLDAYAVAGEFILLGSAVGDHDVYPVSGNNLDPAPLGGWYCYAVDPANATGYETIGTPSGTINFLGGGISATQQARGLTHFAIDAIRIGRCKAIVTGGTSTDPEATFALVNTTLDAVTTGSFGIFDSQYGAFYMQGLLQLGDNTSGTGQVDFTDSNKTVNIRNTPQVGANFNRIEIQNGSTVSSNVSWTGCSFNNIGSLNPVAATASRGDLEVIDVTANVDIATCSFSDMGTFDFGSGTTIIGTSFSRCGLMTQASATITDCTISDSVNAIFLSVNDISKVTGTTFVGDGTTTPGHAVDLGTLGSVGGVTINWANFLDNGTTNQAEWGGVVQTPTTINTGDANSAILVNVATGNSLKISVGTGATIPTVYVTGGGSLEITANEVTLTITVKDITTGLVVEGAMVYCTNLAATATYINKEETNASGVVSFIGTLGSAQTLAGRVAAGTPATKAYTKYYKTAPIDGPFSNTADTDMTIQLIPDE